MDINQVRTLLKLNGLEASTDEAAIQALLAKAGYSEDESRAAFAMLRGGAPAAAINDSSATPSAPAIEMKGGNKASLVPKNWKSLHGVAFILVCYFIVAPALGYGLLFLFLMLAPVLGAVALIGALFLVYIGHYTGINMLVNFYTMAGTHAYAEAQNALSAPYEVMAVSCPEGRAFAISAEKHHAAHSHSGTFGTYYTVDSYLDGFATFTSGTQAERLRIAPTDSSSDLSPLAFGAASYVFPLYLPGPEGYQNRTVLQSILAGDSGTPAQQYIQLSKERFTKEDIEAFASCLDAHQVAEGATLKTQSELIYGIAGFFLETDAVPGRSAVRDETFTCDGGYQVETIPPHYIGMRLSQGGGEPAFHLRLGEVSDDGSVRVLTPDEIDDLDPSTFSMDIRSFEKYDTCLATRKTDCPEDARVKTPSGTFDTVTATSDPYRYFWFIKYMRDTYSKHLAEIHLPNGLPQSFDSCVTTDGKTIEDVVKGS